MKTDNELIKNFMCLEISKGVVNDSRIYYHIRPFIHDSLIASEDQFLYDKSWDWLMPVVEKWNNISKKKQAVLSDYYLDLDNPDGWRAWSYRWVHLTTDINYVYDKLLESIKWYNESIGLDLKLKK
jgi:hypothetical protein